MKKKWNGQHVCDVCKKQIHGILFDARIPRLNCWATLCQSCADKHGVKTGTGLGQKYEQDGEDFVKAEG